MQIRNLFFLDCDYKCHTWCLNQVCRVCAYVVIAETQSFELEICPEAADGLAGQNYRCAECLNRTSYSMYDFGFILALLTCRLKK